MIALFVALWLSPARNRLGNALSCHSQAWYDKRTEIRWMRLALLRYLKISYY